MPETKGKIKYKRVLLKLSGEALAGANGFGVDYAVVDAICSQIKACVKRGAQIAIVVGGGNYWRGRAHDKMNRVRADHIGMLATAMNALVLEDALRAKGVDARTQSAVDIPGIAEGRDAGKAVRHLEKGRVVLFAAGTGSPFFSTDTAAALRAAEIEADIIFKATMVDGVYDSDPVTNPGAKKYDSLSFSKVLADGLRVMDLSAASMCRESGVPLLVFNLNDPENIVRALLGENIGTIVKEEKS